LHAENASIFESYMRILVLNLIWYGTLCIAYIEKNLKLNSIDPISVFQISEDNKKKNVFFFNDIIWSLGNNGFTMYASLKNSIFLV